jgi:ribosomal protein S18 acetylase RimI-like enzyme
MDFAIRAARAQDAVAIATLIGEFQNYLRELGDPSDFGFGASAYITDGFGDSPAFAGLVAESSGQIVAYLLYHFGYDTDRAQRLVHVIDLYVQEARRHQGIGAALMRAAAGVGRAHGAKAMIWSVYKSNALAMAFYEALGAKKINDLEFMVMRIEEDEAAVPLRSN